MILDMIKRKKIDKLSLKDFKITKRDRFSLEDFKMNYNDQLMDANRELLRRVERSYDEMHAIMAEIININNIDAVNKYDRFGDNLNELLIALMKYRNLYQRDVLTWDVKKCINAASLHDIGKFGISENILLKQGKLTDAETEIVRTHVTIGSNMLNDVSSKIGTSDFISMAQSVVKYHHERWDGNGYPHNVVGNKIPLLARIVSIIDTYESLVTDRPYRTAIEHNDAIDIICNESGKQFDPELIRVIKEHDIEFK